MSSSSKKFTYDHDYTYDPNWRAYNKAHRGPILPEEVKYRVDGRPYLPGLLRNKGLSEYGKRVSKHGTVYNYVPPHLKKETYQRARDRLLHRLATTTFYDRYGERIPNEDLLPKPGSRPFTDKHGNLRLHYNRVWKLTSRPRGAISCSLNIHPTLHASLKYHAHVRDATLNKLINDILYIWAYAASIPNKPQTTLPPAHFPKDNPPGYLQSLGYSKPPPLTELTKWLEWAINEDKKMPK